VPSGCKPAVPPAGRRDDPPGVELLTMVSSSMLCFPAGCRFTRSFDNRGDLRYGTVDQFVYERAADALDGLCLLPGEVELPQDAFGLAGANAFGAGTRIRGSSCLMKLRPVSHRFTDPGSYRPHGPSRHTFPWGLLPLDDQLPNAQPSDL
jgi:hypothetical protein